MSSSENSPVFYFCHGCQCKTLEVENQDGELKCLRCDGEFVELIDDSEIDDSLTPFLSNQPVSSYSGFPSTTQSNEPSTSNLLTAPTPVSSSSSNTSTSQRGVDSSTTTTSNNSSNIYPSPASVLFGNSQDPHQQPLLPPSHLPFSPFSSNQFRPPLSNGFRISFSGPEETRLVPSVPRPFASPQMFTISDQNRGNVQADQQPTAFTATVNNVDFSQFMNSLFDNIGHFFVDAAGFDRAVQFIMENDVNRFGSPPASAALVAALPEETLTAETATGDCAICQEDFKMGDTVKRFPCQLHSFHPYCIGPWLTEHNSCPVCRFELPTDDPDYERRRLHRQQQQQQFRGSEAQQQPLTTTTNTELRGSPATESSPPSSSS